MLVSQLRRKYGQVRIRIPGKGICLLKEFRPSPRKTQDLVTHVHMLCGSMDNYKNDEFRQVGNLDPEMAEWLESRDEMLDIAFEFFQEMRDRSHKAIQVQDYHWNGDMIYRRIRPWKINAQYCPLAQGGQHLTLGIRYTEVC